MPRPDAPPLPPIARTLAGRRVLVTGATGFVGKVVIEKLLWSVPAIGKLVLLVRPGEGGSARERLHREILGSPPFARLRALHGDGWRSWAEEKIEVVPGDLASERLGLDPAAYRALAGSIDAIVASAATVRFDERLDRALAINARGALAALRLARDAGEVPLVQLSTAFVSGRRAGTVREEIATLGAAEVDPEALLAELEALAGRIARRGHGARERGAADPPGSAPGGSADARAADLQVEAGRRMAHRHGFHDVYTLTKALAERLIESRRSATPVAVVRPGIVESALDSPMPGWIDGVRVADPLLVAYGRGRLRTLPGHAGAPLELVPVDLVANAVIVALASLAARPEGPAPPIAVYQIGSGGRPVTLGELMEGAREGFSRTPMRTPEGRPIRLRRARFLAVGAYRRRLRRRRAALSWLAGALGAVSNGLGRRLAAPLAAIDHFLRLLEVYGPYLDHPARYDDTRARALAARLAARDRSTFSFDAAAVEWRRYLAEIHLPGLIRYALRAESGAPEAGAGGGERAAAPDPTPATRATTLFDLLRLAAERHPRRVALQACRDGRWLRYTYAEAVAITANVARTLRDRHGVGRGDRVALWAGGRPEWVLAAFAVHRLGAAIVPLDPQWPADEVEAAARFAGAKLVCAAPELAPALAGGSIPVVELAAPLVPEPWVRPLPGAPIGHRAVPGDLAAILFTSGTTLKPKAVPLTHANYLANVRDLVPVMESNGERLLSVLPVHHAFEYTVGLLVPRVSELALLARV